MKLKLDDWFNRFSKVKTTTFDFHNFQTQNKTSTNVIQTRDRRHQARLSNRLYQVKKFSNNISRLNE